MSGRKHADSLRGASKLVIAATKGITDLVAEMQRTIGSGPAVLGKPLAVPARHITHWVHAPIRGVTDLVGNSIDLILARLGGMLGEEGPNEERDAVLAALNGVLGDYLVETGNPLAIPMTLSLPDPSVHAQCKLLVMIHGSSMNPAQWNRMGHDHGEVLARELGYSVAYLHYNSGLHISENGQSFAEALESLVRSWPTAVEEVVLLGHSMGGLVARSACAFAEAEGLAWRKNLRSLVCLGSPHHGSPLERGGNWVEVLLGVSRYSAPFARLGQIRSAGVTDLRFGNVRKEDWQGRERFAMEADSRKPLPLPEEVSCYAIAGALGTPDEFHKVNLLGDGLVLVDSALGRHTVPGRALNFPENHQCIVHGVSHLDLLSSQEVYQTLRGWLSAGSPRKQT
jgi:pimeloyl-ACP methyl ester carboxylesterase